MTSSPVAFAVFAVVVLASSLALVQLIAPFVISYHLADEGFEVRVLRILRVIRIPYASVTEVRKVSFSETLFPRSAGMFAAARAGNRLFARHGVAIGRTFGLRKTVIISPSNPDDFVRQLQDRVRAHTGRA
jgi:hypothetical protein